MSNEYDDDDNLAGLPTFRSNPSARTAPGKGAARAPVWESPTMAGVREAVETKAKELGVSRHAILASDMASTLDPGLHDQFYQALAAYHKLPPALHGQPRDIAFDAAPGAVASALEGLKALDAAEPLVAPVAAADAVEAVATEPKAGAVDEPGPGAAEGGAGGDTVTLTREQFESLMRAAEAVHAKQSGTPEVSPENIAEAAEAIRQGSKTPGAATTAAPGVVKTNVGEAAALATQGALSAGAAVVGGALKGTVGAVRKGFDAMRPAKNADAEPSMAASGKVRPMVLPQLSEYRVNQIEDQVNKYTAAQEAFWASGTLPDVRKAIEEKARETGLSVEDVMDKMKPGGEMHELHERYVDAYNKAPQAADHRKAMNKAIDGFVRQYGSAHEEMLAPEQQGADYFEGYKSRVETAKERIFKKAGHVPLLDGEDKTNLQKLQEAVAKIIEKVREMISGFTNKLRGQAGAEKETVNEPAP